MGWLGWVGYNDFFSGFEETKYTVGIYEVRVDYFS